MDVKKLSVVVEQTGIAPTAKNLESLAKASDNAAPAVERLSSSLKGFKSVNIDSFATQLQQLATAIKDIKTSTSGMADIAKNIGGLSVNLTNIANATDRLSAKTSDVSAYVAQIKALRVELEGMKGLSVNIGKVTTSGSSSSKASSVVSSANTEATDSLTKAQQRLATQIERTAMMVGKQKSEYLALRAAQEGITDITAKHITTIASAEKTTGKYVMSTRELNAAMRMVPAQFTDIATQLAGGQSPMLIMLQQGGQLKDMFHGLGPMLKNVGGMVLNFIVSPFTLAIGAIAGVVYALYTSQSELSAFNKVMTTTNGISGMSTENFYKMRDSISSVAGTQGKASDALLAIAGSSKLAGLNVESIGIAAVKMEALTGQSVEDTVKQFESLGEKPSEAILKLNDKYHFLTASTYDNITALEKQGNMFGATKAAAQAFQDAIDKMTTESIAKAGYIERSWYAIKKAIVGAKDAALSWGSDDPNKPIAALDRTIANIQKNISEMKRTGSVELFGVGLNESESQLASLMKQREQLRINLSTQTSMVKAQSDEVKEAERANKSRSEFGKITESNMSKEAKKLKEINDLKKSYEGLGNKTSQDKTDYQANLEAINEKYKDKSTSGAKNDMAQIYSARIAEAKDYSETQIKIVKDRLTEQKITEETAASDILILQTQSSDKRVKLLEEQYSKTKDIGDKAKINEGIKAALNESEKAWADYTAALAKMSKEYQSYQNSVVGNASKVADKLEEENDAIRLQIDNLGVSEAQQGRNEAQKLRVAAAADYAAAAILREAYAIREATGASMEAISHYPALADAIEKTGDKITAQADLRLEKGMKENQAEIEKGWKKTNEKISDNITDALMKGFEKGKTLAQNFRDTLTNMFKTLVLRPTVQAIVTGGMGLVGMSTAQAAGSTASTVGGIGNIASMGNSAWGAYTGGIGSAYGAFANSSVGAGLGLSTAQAAGYMAPVYGEGGALLSAGTGTAAGGLTGAGATIGAALPYVGAALAAVTLITSLMKKGGGPKTEGDAYATLSNSGISSLSTQDAKGNNYITGTGSNNIVESLVTPIGKSVASLITSLGGNAAGIGLNLGFSTDPKGTAKDNIQSGVMDAQGNYVYRNGRNAERGTYDTELQLETQRMLVAAVKASDVSQVYKDVANSVDLYTASAEELQTVLSNLTAITTLRTAFDTLGFGADKLSTSLITAAGGAETLNTNLNSYYDNYYSTAEKNANITKQVTKALNDVGVAMPASKAAFRSVVEGLDLTTSSGQAAFAAMMSVSASFSSLIDSAATVKQAADEAAKTSADLLATRIKASYDLVDAAYSKLEDSVTAQKKTLQDAYEIQAAIYKSSIEAATATKETLTSLNDALETAVKTVELESDTKLALLRAEAQAALNTALTASKSGSSLTAYSESISTAIEDLSKPSEQLYSSFEDYARDQGRASATLSALKTVAGSQKSLAEQTLNEITNAADLAELQNNRAQDALDKILTDATAQINELKGINTSVLSVAAAIANLGSVIAMSKAVGGGLGGSISQAGTMGAAAGYSTNDAGVITQKFSGSWDQSLVKDTWAANPGAYAAVYQSAALNGQSLATLDTIFGQPAGTAAAAADKYGLTKFAVGTNYVPEDMLAMVHKGERITPAGDNKQLIGRLSTPSNKSESFNAEALLTTMEAMKQEMVMLRFEARAIVVNTSENVKLIKRVMPDGDAISTREAAPV